MLGKCRRRANKLIHDTRKPARNGDAAGVTGLPMHCVVIGEQEGAWLKVRFRCVCGGAATLSVVWSFRLQVSVIAQKRWAISEPRRTGPRCPANCWALMHFPRRMGMAAQFVLPMR